MQVEAIKQSLENCGLRCTPQHAYAVMEFLMGMPSPSDGGGRHLFPEAVNRIDPRFLKSHNYNNLRDLVQKRVWCAKWPSRVAPRG